MHGPIGLDRIQRGRPNSKGTGVNFSGPIDSRTLIRSGPLSAFWEVSGNTANPAFEKGFALSSVVGNPTESTRTAAVEFFRFSTGRCRLAIEG